MKPRSFDTKLARLVELRTLEPTPEIVAELGALLADKSNHLAGKAARIAGERQLTDLIPDLVQSFERFMINPAKTDPTCVAKTAIVKALEEMAAPTEQVYLRGIRHRQVDSFAGDTAYQLRAASALGLVHMDYPDALLEVVRLLVDEHPQARLGAVRAIAAFGGASAVPLLRLQALRGGEVDMLEECFTGLLRLDPAKSVPFVAEFLQSSLPEVAESAALSLGASRLSEAFAALVEAWRRPLPRELRRALLLSIATLRREEAIDFLLALLHDDEEQTVAAAIAALALYRDDARIKDRVRSALGSPAARQVFDREFLSPK